MAETALVKASPRDMVVYQNSLTNLVAHNEKGFNKLTNHFNGFNGGLKGVLTTAGPILFRLGRSISKTSDESEKKVNSLSSAFKRLKKELLDVKNIQKGMEAYDQYINTTSKLSQVNFRNPQDGIGKEQQAALKNNIFKAAERSNVSFDSMANSVANLYAGAGNNFRNNKELVAFTELAYKSFGMGSSEEQQAGMDQLIQAMSANGGQGGNFDSVIQSSPMLANALMGYTGKSMEELMKLAREGKITAATVKNAFIYASRDINEQFGDKPKTFAGIFQTIRDRALKAFAPLMEKISVFLSSPAVGEFINLLTAGFTILANVAGYIFDALSWLFGLIMNNWTIILPILVAVKLMMIAWSLRFIPMVISAVSMLGSGILKLGGQFLLAGFKALMAFWPLILIFIVIAGVIGLVIYFIMKFGSTVVDVIGFTAGIFAVFIAYIINKFLNLWYGIISIKDSIVNAFMDVVYKVKKLFYDLSISVLQALLGLAGGIQKILDNIPGLKVNITGDMENLLKTLESERGNLKNEADVEKTTKEFKQIDYSSAFIAGNQLGREKGAAFVDKFQTGFGKLLGEGKVDDFEHGIGYEKYMENGAMPVTPKDGSLNVDMSGEDLKYLKDIAEREYINQYSTATLAPSLNVSFGNVTKEADVDKLVGRIQKILNEELAVVSEGVY